MHVALARPRLYHHASPGRRRRKSPDRYHAAGAGRGAHGIAFLPWSPLRGTGGAARAVGERFGAFAEIGARHDVSPQQVVLAWELALDPHVIPIPGARRAASIVDSAKAVDLELTVDEVETLSRAVNLAD